MKIHKATFFWNSEKKRQQLTACGNHDFLGANPTKTTDWNEVTCKHCLRNKDNVPFSTTSINSEMVVK
jgi:hypothetical protein